MVRTFPGGGNHPLPSRVFIFAFIAATIAVVSFLCGKKKRKRSLSSTNNHATRPKHDTDQPLMVSSTTNDPDPTNESTYIKIDDDPEPTVQNENKLVLPPPPRLASIRATSCHIGENSNRSQSAKLTSSLSMRLTGGLKGLKKGTKKDENDKLTREDSLLSKTIILGEKCRIPDEDEDDIILDENGQRITTFHRKPSCSSISRQSSVNIRT